jgi:hypothetical protein
VEDQCKQTTGKYWMIAQSISESGHLQKTTSRSKLGLFKLTERLETERALPGDLHNSDAGLTESETKRNPDPGE